MMRTMRWGLLLALFAAMLVAGCQRTTPDARETATAQGPSEGSAAPTGHVFDPQDTYALAGSPVKGSEQALVTIVEFSEFQCPFCSRVVPTMTELLANPEFGSKIRVVFKHLPLDFHDRAMPAARAAYAAHRQGKFWEFHDLLFENQRGGLNDADFTTYATQLGLNLEQFAADMASPEAQAAIDADVAVATRLGIRGTPNFLINGRPLTGAQPADQFATIIREEITAMEALIAQGKTASVALGERIAANQAAAPAAGAQQQAQRPARPTPDPADELYVPVGASAVKGPDDALVTIVEFSEFQCPFCSRVGPTVQQIIDTYGADVRIVFKHNPLSFHERAPAAARAAIAAQNQGKFWEYHDILFQNQQALADADLERYAEQLGLNLEQFRRDIAAPETQARIDEDMALARRLAAGGTPHFFINGTRVRGAQPFEQFQRVIDAELTEARALVTAGTPRAGVYDALQADANRAEARMITPPPQAAPEQPAAPTGPVNITVTDEPFLGSATAPVTMVIYSDYTCGYCKRFHTTIYEAHAGYEDRVRVVFKQFPRGADTLALAAWAAHQQGQFWPFSDRLMAGGVSDRDGAIALAGELGLNVERFTTDMDAPATRERVAAQKAEGQGFGVRGTPTWYLNGMQNVGAFDTARLRAAWDAALAPAAAPGTGAAAPTGH